MNYSDGSEVEVQKLHVPNCSIIISKQGLLYTCSEEQARNYIGQNEIDMIEPKCDTKLSEGLLKKSFVCAVGYFSLLRRFKSVCSMTLGIKKTIARNIFFLSLDRIALFAAKIRKARFKFCKRSNQPNPNGIFKTLSAYQRSAERQFLLENSSVLWKMCRR